MNAINGGQDREKFSSRPAKTRRHLCGLRTGRTHDVLFLPVLKKEKLTPGAALAKLMTYCRYQERCHQEVREKLAGYGVFGKDADEITARLIEENFLNEERFAIQFAGGRFRIKQWGRQKIELALKRKGVSPWCIKRAMSEIEEPGYESAFEKLAEKQWSLLVGRGSWLARKQKFFRALCSRGYETERIQRFLTEKEIAERQKRNGKKKS